ncbi:MAG: hypothetical protein ABIF17_01215 [Patescibacteria group bacterium]
MILLKRLIPFCITILNLVFLEVIIQKPNLIIWLSSCLFISSIFLIFYLVFKKMKSGDLCRFVLSVALIIVTEVASLLFIESLIIKHLLVIVTSGVLFFYSECLFLFLYFQEKYKAYSLENINNMINLFVFFLAQVTVFALIVFMNLSFLTSILVVLFFSCVSLFLSFENSKVELKHVWRTVFVGCLLLAEVFFILTWLPFSFYLKALMLTVFYYLFNGVMKLRLTASLDKKQIYKFFFVFVGVWLLCFLTARWM